MLPRFRPLPWPREKSVRPVKATWICPRQYPSSHPHTAHAEACRREAKSFLRHSPAPDPFEHRSRNPPPVRRSLRPNLAAQQAACGDGAAFASVQAFPHFRAPAIPHPLSKQWRLLQKTRTDHRRRREGRPRIHSLRTFCPPLPAPGLKRHLPLRARLPVKIPRPHVGRSCIPRRIRPLALSRACCRNPEPARFARSKAERMPAAFAHSPAAGTAPRQLPLPEVRPRTNAIPRPLLRGCGMLPSAVGTPGKARPQPCQEPARPARSQNG